MKLEVNTNKITEEEIQFELAYKLKELGFNIYLERTFKLPYWVKTKRAKIVTKIRVDIVVCLDDEIIGVIEVKNYTKKGIRESIHNPDARQLKKYKALKLPFCYCWNENYIDKSVEWVKRISKTKEVLSNI